MKNKVHEWKTVTVWYDGFNEELQRYEREGWQVHQFLGTATLGNDVIGYRIVIKRAIDA